MSEEGGATHHVYAATICVTKKRIYGAVKALQKVGIDCYQCLLFNPKSIGLFF
jgi:hypothetical protein